MCLCLELGILLQIQWPIEYLYKHCPPESGIIMFRSLPEPPGYEV